MGFSTLNIGASGLFASQRAVETAAHNVSNSAVEGYTRQRVTVATAPPSHGVDGVRGTGMRGNGVTVVEVTRLRDALADTAVRREADSAGFTAARAQVLDRTQGLLGPYGGGVPQALSALWGAFDQLALNPSDPAARQIVVDAASEVAGGFRDAAALLDQVRLDISRELPDLVGEVNALAEEVVDLNRRIVDAQYRQQSPNDLRDRRDTALDRLAELTGATASARPDGSVTVSIGQVELVQGTTAHPVTYSGSPTQPVLLLQGRALYSENPASRHVGGLLGGRMEAVRVDVVRAERDLDAAVATFADRVNGLHAQGYDGTGARGGDVFGVRTGDRFTARELVVVPGFTPDRVAASATEVPGGSRHDGEHALELARLRTARDPEGVTLGDRLHKVVTTMGSLAAGALGAAEAAALGYDAVRQMRETSNGVSVDEEMIDLVKFQHAYSAAARVISIADGMLDTLVNRMGAGR